MAIYHPKQTGFQRAIKSQIMRYYIGVFHMGSIAYFADNSNIKAFNNKRKFWNLENHAWLEHHWFIGSKLCHNLGQFFFERPICICFNADATHRRWRVCHSVSVFKNQFQISHWFIDDVVCSRSMFVITRHYYELVLVYFQSFFINLQLQRTRFFPIIGKDDIYAVPVL